MHKILLFVLINSFALASKAQVKEVLKVERAILDAFCKNDTQFIKNSVDDQFIVVRADGLIQRKNDFVRAYLTFTPEYRLTITTELEQAIDKGDIVILIGRVENAWQEGQNRVGNKAKYTGTYQKRGKNWYLLSSFVNDLGEDYYKITDTIGIWADIQKRYQLLDRSVENKDLCQHLNLKTQDFATIDERGNYASAQFMRNRSKLLFSVIQDSIDSHNEVLSMEVKGDTVKVMVQQSFNRNQRAGGKIRYFQTLARQRESWMRTREGWKLVFVDNPIAVSRIIDGVVTDPNKPVNWNDPAFIK